MGSQIPNTEAARIEIVTQHHRAMDLATTTANRACKNYMNIYWVLDLRSAIK